MDGSSGQYALVRSTPCHCHNLIEQNSLGDLRYKKFGVTPEPEVRTKLLNGTIHRNCSCLAFWSEFAYVGEDWAYMVLVSDGVSSILSDEEVVDLARNAPDPKTAADRILSFAEELGGGDNATAIVVPFAGWGKIQGPDKTKELREYRRRQAGV